VSAGAVTDGAGLDDDGDGVVWTLAALLLPLLHEASPALVSRPRVSRARGMATARVRVVSMPRP